MHVAVDETTTADEPRASSTGVRLRPRTSVDRRRCASSTRSRCPRRCAARAPYLEHPVFNTHQSETQMMRYLKQLADRDYALDRGMIPLGSCTMKLNAATEMQAVTWPEFANLHPFAPEADVEGYARAHRAARELARRGHRLRHRVAAAERRQPGRARRAPRDPRLPPRERRRRRATCASSRRARTARTRHPPCSPACASWSWPATSSATSTSTTCARRSTSTPTASPRS